VPVGLLFRQLRGDEIKTAVVFSGSAADCRFPDLNAGQLKFRMALQNMSDNPWTTIANDQIIRA